MNKTIYTTIIGLIGEDGSLTEQPHFPENQLFFDDGTVAEYAPGEIDGHTLYFNGFGFDSHQDEASDLLDAAIADLEAGNLESARAKFQLFGTSGRMVPASEHFLETLRQSGGSIDQDALECLARELLTQGTCTEEVKAGLCIVELFAEDDRRILDECVRTLSLCDEFAPFCIRIALHFPDSDSVLEEMGRHASAWGHIHLSELGDLPYSDDLPEEFAELFCPELYALDWDDEQDPIDR